MKQLAKKLKKLLASKKLLDIIIFGSVAKGKSRANDLDVAVVAEKKIDLIQLKKEISSIAKTEVHLQLLKLADYDKFIWLTMLREGFSVRHGKYLFQLLRIKPVVLYKYSLKEISASKKVMFERAIKNFKNIEKLSNRVVLVPIELSGGFSDFLKQWEIDFESGEYGLMPLVRQSEF